MNTLREALQEYIDPAPGLGYKMHCEGLLLPRFVSFMEDHNAEHISAGWRLSGLNVHRYNLPSGPDAFASCAASLAIAAPPTAARRSRRSACLPHRSTRARPHLYTEDEIRRLLDAALELPVTWPSTPLRPWVFPRPDRPAQCDGHALVRSAESQACRRRPQAGGPDDSWRQVRSVAVGADPSIYQRDLADYIERRAQFFRHPVSPYLFVTRRGNRLDSGHVHRTFYTLSRSTGLRVVGASKGPRLHDFRHRFAVQTLTRWYQADKDPGRQMPLLSTYLGHVCVSGTYWYLSANPELMAQAMARLERRWGESS
jgi:integrase/recombinase XerD